MLLASASTIFTVSHLNQKVRQLLEMEMGLIWLSGEISNFSSPSSGHWYFTLKDQRAQVRCAMFRTANNRVKFRPHNGQQVLIRANITLYEPRGDYQIIAEVLQSAGDGLLQQQFEQLKQKLKNAGLFEATRKRALPIPTRQIGIITSSTGAALHDILHVLQRRDPSLPVVIYPTQVQGANAALFIAKTIELANQRGECDLLILGRGGGSLEDLWSFNEEIVAYAIYQSHIPIVSAVGHETDVTIADFVADLRAPTPSAAAELVSRNQLELIRQLHDQQQRLEMTFDYYLAQKNRDFNQIYHCLQQQQPQLRLSHQQMMLLKLKQRLQDALYGQLRRSQQEYERLCRNLLLTPPQTQIYHHQQLVQQYLHRLQKTIERQLSHAKQRLEIKLSQLDSASPLAILSRGYSMTFNTKGSRLKNIKTIKKQQIIKTQLSDGWIESEVIQLTKNH